MHPDWRGYVGDGSVEYFAEKPDQAEQSVIFFWRLSHLVIINNGKTMSEYTFWKTGKES